MELEDLQKDFVLFWRISSPLLSGHLPFLMCHQFDCLPRSPSVSICSPFPSMCIYSLHLTLSYATLLLVAQLLKNACWSALFGAKMRVKLPSTVVRTCYLCPFFFTRWHSFPRCRYNFCDKLCSEYHSKSQLYSRWFVSLCWVYLFRSVVFLWSTSSQCNTAYSR